MWCGNSHRASVPYEQTQQLAVSSDALKQHVFPAEQLNDDPLSCTYFVGALQCVELGGFDACLPVGTSISAGSMGADTTTANSTLLWGLIGGEDGDDSQLSASGSYNRLADALLQGRRTLQEVTNTLNVDNRTFGIALELLEGALCDSFPDDTNRFDVETTAVSSLALACSLGGFDLPLKRFVEAASAASMNEHLLSECIQNTPSFAHFCHPDGLEALVPSLHSFCTLHGLDARTRSLASRFGNAIVSRKFYENRNSSSVSAVCVYQALKLSRNAQQLLPSQAAFCRRIGVADVTLRTMLREISPFWDEILSSPELNSSPILSSQALARRESSSTNAGVLSRWDSLPLLDANGTKVDPSHLREYPRPPRVLAGAPTTRAPQLDGLGQLRRVFSSDPNGGTATAWQRLHERVLSSFKSIPPQISEESRTPRSSLPAGLAAEIVHWTTKFEVQAMR